jgi:hypothetical protein
MYALVLMLWVMLFPLAMDVSCILSVYRRSKVNHTQATEDEIKAIYRMAGFIWLLGTIFFTTICIYKL